MFGIVSLVMVVLLCIGWWNFGFLFLMKYSFRFIVLGMVRMFENRMVVFSGNWCSGCRVIL